MDRTKHRWNCQLQAESGEIVERDFETYWSPERDFITDESVAFACAARETIAAGKPHAGITAVKAA